ncbi:MAG: glycosyltransferase family 39 protein [Pyrinomonadaceae bacterium]
MVEHHKSNAAYLLQGDLATFVKGPAPPGDANILTYPPGYPITMAAVFGLFSESDTSMRLFQIICDAAGAILLFFIAAELLPVKAAAIAGVLAALSPQLAYYSLLLIPDSLATLPILLALFFLIRTAKKGSFRAAVAVGVCIGVSCWIRSNALLLAPFLALLLLVILDRGKRWSFAAALVGATIIVISPITIRNLVVFHHFIPLSLGTGQMLNVGISDYDREKRFGLPTTDIETVSTEAQLYNRPDYGSSLFGGNGAERDHDRTRRGLSVIRSHPVWFAGVVIRRAFSMLKLERVHILSTAPAVTHPLNLTGQKQLVWANKPSDFMAVVTGPQTTAKISLAVDGQSLLIEAPNLQAGNQIVSLPIRVEKHSDYLFRIPIKVEQGSIVFRITSLDQTQVFGSTPVFHPLELIPGSNRQTATVRIPFVSRDTGSVRLVVSNEDRRPAPTVVEIGRTELFRLGPASALWTKYVRIFLNGLQMFFITAWMIPLAVIGAVLLTARGGARTIVVLLAIPLYYLSAQSFLHTEYRYVLVIQSVLFVLVAVTLYWLIRTTAQIIRRYQSP